MKHTLLIASALLALSTTLPAGAQEVVDYKKYPDYSPRLKADPKLRARATSTALPDHVNNAETQFFPAIINQAGGSCGSASRIYYMFGYEINALRGTNAKLDENRYPTHFTWLLTNSNSSKDGMAIANGIPNVTTYGGATYSKLFGNQDTSDPNFGWMQGYDKWYSAMWNRLERTANFPQSVETEEGRLAVKQWLYNHSDNPDYPNGGVCGIGVASGGTWKSIPSTTTNTAIGVAGQYYVGAWGSSVDHALTIVGYDDRIEFDLDGNGVAGEKDKDEVGAWIIANSWGSGWCNNGFIYCPYKHARTTTTTGSFYAPEIYYIRRNYRPLRTIKLTMEYSKRSELCLSAGISSDLSATEPERTTQFEHFKYAGDGDGNGVDADVPMLGSWNGTLNYDPMEFGYDLTDLSAGFNTRQPLKYFFIVESKSGASGEGKIDAASIIDYEFDREGIETPFDVGADGVTIQNQGNKTIISVVVAGEQFNAPRNLTFTNGTLKWDAPATGSYTLTGYSIYRNDTLETSPAIGTTSYTVADASGSYQIAANYTFNDSTIQSSRVAAPSGDFYGSIPTKNYSREFTNSGIRIKDLFTEVRPKVTIEYWIRPSSTVNWNQQIGPGWSDNFLVHTSSTAQLIAGWSTGNRFLSEDRAMRAGRWSHVAIVVDGSTMRGYVNGELVGEATGSTTGIGGFGDLLIGRANESTGISGRLDEVRVWNTARTQREIQSMMYAEVADPTNTPGLLVEVKMDKMTEVSDATGKYEVELLAGTTKRQMDNSLLKDTRTLTADFTLPAGTLYTGTAIEVGNASSGNAVSYKWTIDGDEDNALQIDALSLLFSEAGTHRLTLTVADASGNTATKDSTFTVSALPIPTPGFTAKEAIEVGKRISFTNTTTPTDGAAFEWSMPGADVEKTMTTNAAATYQTAGTYTVTLKVTNAAGSATYSRKVLVTDRAPEAAFDVSPNVVVKGNPVTLTDQSEHQPTGWDWIVSNAGHHFAYKGEKTDVVLSDPGRYNVTLTASNIIGEGSTTEQKAITVCNADAVTGLSFRGNTGEGVTFKNPIDFSVTGGFTVDWWMNPKSINDEGQHIGGTSDNFMLTVGSDGALNVTMKNVKNSTSAGFIETDQWHHYAVTFGGGDFNIYKDGKLAYTFYTPWVDVLPTMPANLSLGGSEGLMNGTIDEFRIWNKALNATTLRTYANAPITDVETAMADDNLALYYDFNQSSGNVKDATTNNYTGTRSGFGPEGDAWTTSLGVFCLDEFERTVLTSEYLKNYEAPFLHNDTKVSASADAAQFVGMETETEASPWVIEKVTTSNGTTTGFCVDTEDGDQLALLTKLYDFADQISNHKLYQTVTLPAGHYVFGVEMPDDVDEESYIVAYAGVGLPYKTTLKNRALAYATLPTGEIEFTLTEETKVSLGLLMNTRGEMTQHVKRFYLESKITNAGDDTNGIDIIDVDAASALRIVGGHGAIVLKATAPTNVRIVSISGHTIFNRVVSGSAQVAVPAGVYVVNGKKVLVN